MINLKKIMNLPYQMWFFIGTGLIILGLFPGIVFFLLGAIAFLYAVYLYLRENGKL